MLGSEIDDGTVVHILAKPLPRWQIVLPKLAVAAVVTAVTVGVPLYVAGVLRRLGTPRRSAWRSRRRSARWRTRRCSWR